jgi:predicted Zn-dependent peptidase
MLLNSNFLKSEFEKEKNVIVDEIIRAQDNTEGYLNEKIYSVLFKVLVHFLKFLTIKIKFNSKSKC